MRKYIFLLLLTLTTITSFSQFSDTSQLGQYIRDTIKDRRPYKVTALQVQKGMLGLKQFLTPGGGGGGSMVYPGAGIPLSTGSGWGTSITNNSGNWNTAYSWGNHAGLYPGISLFLDSLLSHTTRFNGVTGLLNSKFSLADTGLAFTPYARIEAAATGSIVKWNSDRALGVSSILYDNGTNAGATSTFLAPSMKSPSSTSYYSFRVDGNLGMGEVFSDGSYIQRLNLAGYHYIQSVNPPANGLFIGVFPGQSYINFKNNGRMSFDTLGDIPQRYYFKGSGRFTDTLFGITLSLLDNSDAVATTAWVKAQGYGTGGVSDGYVDGATFSTSTNTLTLTQTGAADVTVRIPPSYLQNPMDADSLLKQVNDSLSRMKAVKVVSDHPEILVTATRNDSINTHTLSKIYLSEPIATFSAGAGFVADTSLFTDSTLYGSFFTSQDSFYIDRVIVVLKGQAGDTLGLQILYNDSINITGTVVSGGTIAVNSRTIGNTTTVSTNRGIPPNSWVWVKSPTVIAGKRPEYLAITLVGYKKWIAP